MNHRSFASAADFRAWLERHHATTPALVVAFFLTSSGRGGLTYAGALDEALCFGWIDGVRRRIDADRFTIRFTPRKRGSIWSLVNVRHVERLTKAGRMHAAGLAAFAARDPRKTGIYSFENRPQDFPPALKRFFRAAHRGAWDFFQTQPPGYRRTAIWWVISAKQDATRSRRLAQLIADSAAGRRLRLLSR
ncbi:MAG TPA: YdeI/OmpD-associated family protein [Opitutus sp.]|nr:YdeI/OmpD-associated family protein [Opitutus sp.]